MAPETPQPAPIIANTDRARAVRDYSGKSESGDSVLIKEGELLQVLQPDPSINETEVKTGLGESLWVPDGYINTVPAATTSMAPEAPQPAPIIENTERARAVRDYSGKSESEASTPPPLTPSSVISSVTAVRSPYSKLALTYLDAALHEAENNIDPPQLVDELCEIAQERSKAGDIEVSHSILAQAKTMALNFSPRLDDERNVALSKIAESEVQVGDKEAAQVYVAEVSATIAANHDLFSRATALSRLGHVQSIIGDIEDSRRTFELAEKAAAQQKNSWCRNHCLTEIAKDQAQTEAQPGNLEAARKTLIRAIGLANALKGSTVRPGLLTDIARTQVQIGEMDGAKRTLKEASECAVRMKETYEKGDTLRDLAQAQAEAGDVAGANSTTSRITDKYDGAKYTYKEEALAAIGNATAAAAQAQLLKRIQEQAREGGATDAEAAVRTWGAAVDRCNGYIQIAIGLLNNSAQ